MGGYTLPDGKWIVYRTEPQRQPPLRGAWTGADIVGCRLEGGGVGLGLDMGPGYEVAADLPP